MRRHNYLFIYLFLFAVCLWMLPFILRLCFWEIPPIDSELLEKLPTHNLSSAEKTVLLFSEEDYKEAFEEIFLNNLKGCLLNILGGTLLGLGTLINLLYNGFFMAHITIFCYESGMSIEDIIKNTLPHSFELIGFWISGAMGFYYTSQIISFMKGKECFTLSFYKKMGIYAIIVFLIILSAAYVEAFITSK